MENQVTVMQPQDDELKAAMMHAEKISDPRYIQAFQLTASWHQTIKTVKKIENDDQLNQAIDFFDHLKKQEKSVEELRVSFVAVPTKFAKLVNSSFKPVKDYLTEIKNHWRGLIDQYQEEAAKLIAEAPQTGDTMQVTSGEGGEAAIGEVQVGQGEAPPPVVSNITQTESGAKVHRREFLEVTIEDPMEFLKAIISTQKKYEEFTVDLIEIKVPQLKEIIKNMKRAKVIPGIKWEKVKRTV